MPSSLTVVTPATSRDLTVLNTVKAELGITTTTEDAKLATWIRQASRMAESYCHRVFGQETVTETFWPDRQWDRFCQPCLYLQRYPVTEITALTEDTTEVGASGYRLDAENGALYRLNTTSYPGNWGASQAISITYTGGYELLDSLPDDIEAAVIHMIRDFRADATRDPNLIEKEIEGVSRYRWWAPTEAKTAMPIEISGLLDPYVRRWGWMT